MPTPSPARSSRPPRSAPATAGADLASRTRPASTADASAPAVSPDDRDRWVEVAAYYIAQRRGFAEGSPLEDWLAAEREFERLLGLCKPADRA